jgi:hypothetical protein
VPTRKRGCKLFAAPETGCDSFGGERANVEHERDWLEYAPTLLFLERNSSQYRCTFFPKGNQRRTNGCICWKSYGGEEEVNRKHALTLDENHTQNAVYLVPGIYQVRVRGSASMGYSKRAENLSTRNEPGLTLVYRYEYQVYKFGRF